MTLKGSEYTAFTGHLIELLENGCNDRALAALTPLKVSQELKERLAKHAPNLVWHHDFHTEPLYFAYNRAYLPGGSAEELKQENAALRRESIKSQCQKFRTRIEQLQSDDRLIASFQGDALAGLYYEDYSRVEASLNQASNRALELKNAALAVEWLTINADLHALQGHQAKAAEYQIKLLELLPEGAASETLLNSLEAKADTLYQQGHYREAIPIRQKVSDLTARLHGPDHPATATSLNNLAELYI